MSKSKIFKEIAFTGNEAATEAMRQIDPDVVAAYPITPSAGIIEKYSKYLADGFVSGEEIRVESEHSAMAACIGASCMGARVMTATDAQGLAYMWELLPITSGLRLPIVMFICNRALSAPANIHCDHSDSMNTRDLSWIQVYCENAQEVYEYAFLAAKIAEHEKVLLPAMVCQDGFLTSGNVEKVKIYEDKVMRNFVGKYVHKSANYFDIKNPGGVGGIVLQEYYFESKRQQTEAMKNVKEVYLKIGKELSKITGNNYPYFDEYKLEDADVAIVTLSSTAETAKEVVDKLRKQGKKVGLLRPILFRPFPYKEIAEALKNVKNVAVLERSESYGAFPPITLELKNALYDLQKKPKLQTYVFGIGGRYIFERDIEKVFEEMLKNKISKEIRYIGVR